MAKTGRVFTASLKPAWTHQEQVEFVETMRGTAFAYCITHDKDHNPETGEVVEPHTHILLDYETPRKLTTVANLLDVEPNFIETVKSKKAMLRYLVHGDDPEKMQYEPDEVVHNNTVPFADLLMGQSLSDKEIAEYIKEGRGTDLLGVVSASKLRTIQAFLQFDRTGQIQADLRQVREDLTYVVETIKRVEKQARNFSEAVTYSADQLRDAMLSISTQLGQGIAMLHNRTKSSGAKRGGIQ